jgi:hypothetical protein
MSTRVAGNVSDASASELSPQVAERFVPIQKSEVVEPFANEVAHDLMNKLTVIKCWTEVMLRRGLATGKGVEYLQNILSAVDRSVTLSEKLHACNCQRPPVDGTTANVSLPRAQEDAEVGSGTAMEAKPKRRGRPA